MADNLIYGLLKDEIVTIEDVESGLKCNCICPHCKTKLIAKKGNIREHHFSHYNADDCLWRGESLFHKISKEIIKNSKTIKLPKVTVKNHPDIILFEETVINIDNVILEQKVGDFIPDIIIETKGKQLLVEIYYRHEIDYFKQRKIRKKKIPTIEIDINPIVNELYNQKDFLLKSSKFQNFLINNTSNKKWIYNPKIEKTDNSLKENYADKQFIKRNKFKHYEGHYEEFIFTEYCPLEKRKWKSGINKNKSYAKYPEDCKRCDYFLGIGEKEIIGSVTGVVHSKENAVLCIGHMYSSFKTDLHIAIKKISTK